LRRFWSVPQWIAHHYFEVDTDVVFRTVQEDVPQMKDVIDRMIAEVEEME